MNVKRLLCLGLFFLLCMQLISCASPDLSEESSVPSEAESSEASPVPAVEDENARLARAYLDSLLTENRSEEGDAAEWMTASRAEAIRDCVKRLKTPILTEEDVRRLAERSAAFYLAAWEGERRISLPACGVLAPVQRSTGTFLRYSECAAGYDALLAYTLYLFTPPEYVFWGSEVWAATDADPAYALCLPFAGEYTTRSGALTAMREQQSCIRLYPIVIDGEYPLDFSYCTAPELLRSGTCAALELGVMATQGNAELLQNLRALYAEVCVQDWLSRILGCETSVYGTYDLPNGDSIGVFLPLSAEDAQEIRGQVELLSEPVLTEDSVRLLAHSIDVYMDHNLPLLLPGVDGAEDVLLPSGIEHAEDALRMSDADVLVMEHGAVAYLIDLLTPPAYRRTDLYTGIRYVLEGRWSVWITDAYLRGEGKLDFLYGRREEYAE